MERTHLSEKEWRSVQNLAAAENTLARTENCLDRRMENPEKLTGAISAIGEVLSEVYSTIPVRELLGIKTELEGAQVHLHYARSANSRNMDDVLMYMRKDDLERLVDVCASVECMVCEKTGHVVDKCPIYKAISGILHYKEKHDKKVPCEIAGRTHVFYNEEEDGFDDEYDS